MKWLNTARHREQPDTAQRTVRLVCLLPVVLLIPAAVHAQDELFIRCQQSISPDATRRFCNLVAEAAAIAQPRIGTALTGGNPLPGGSSTLGKRLGKVPRLSVDGRITAARLELPPIRRLNSNNEVEAFARSLNVDAAVGVFDGLNLLPTVGGFGSLDLVASVGIASLPEDEGFVDHSPGSWALGARVGILRESFTAPGISITAMYRRIGDVSFGDRQLNTEDAYFEMSGLRVVSLRGVVGKRLLAIGATAGIGYDNYKSDLAFGVSNPGVSAPARFDFRHDGVGNDRVSLFGSLHWTLLVLSIVGEGGWQSGGAAVGATLPSGRSSTIENGTYYGTLAVRLAI